MIRTDPRPGIAVAPGTVVDYTISLGAEPSASPDSAEPALVRSRGAVGGRGAGPDR